MFSFTLLDFVAKLCCPDVRLEYVRSMCYRSVPSLSCVRLVRFIEQSERVEERGIHIRHGSYAHIDAKRNKEVNS